LNKKIVLTSVH